MSVDDCSSPEPVARIFQTVGTPGLGSGKEQCGILSRAQCGGPSLRCGEPLPPAPRMLGIRWSFRPVIALSALMLMSMLVLARAMFGAFAIFVWVLFRHFSLPFA